MSLQVSDLNLPADKLGQFAAALGDSSPAYPVLQTYCDDAAGDVNRLTAGYLLDATSLRNFSRAIALFRLYGQIGPVPADIEKSYDAAWKELQSIAVGQRPNLPKTPDPNLASRAGAIGSAAHIHGRLHKRPLQQPGADMKPTKLPYIGPPTSGIFNTGDEILDFLNATWTCTAGGTPGTWIQIAPAITDNPPVVNVPLNYLVQMPSQGWQQFYWDGAAYQPVNLKPS